mgnify:CR=1 FL=1
MWLCAVLLFGSVFRSWLDRLEYSEDLRMVYMYMYLKNTEHFWYLWLIFFVILSDFLEEVQYTSHNYTIPHHSIPSAVTEQGTSPRRMLAIQCMWWEHSSNQETISHVGGRHHNSAIINKPVNKPVTRFSVFGHGYGNCFGIRPTVFLNTALLIWTGFVYSHCTGRWAVFDNTHGKDSDAFRWVLLYSHYHGGPYFH